MAEFIEFKDTKGEKVFVNVEHIIKVRPDNNGTYLYFDVISGNSSCPYPLHVAEKYETVKRKLLQ